MNKKLRVSVFALEALATGILGTPIFTLHSKQKFIIRFLPNEILNTAIAFHDALGPEHNF